MKSKKDCGFKGNKLSLKSPFFRFFFSSRCQNTISFPQRRSPTESRRKVCKNCAGTVKCVRSNVVMKMDSNATSWAKATSGRWNCSKATRAAWWKNFPKNFYQPLQRFCLHGTAQNGWMQTKSIKMSFKIDIICIWMRQSGRRFRNLWNILAVKVFVGWKIPRRVGL